MTSLIFHPYNIKEALGEKTYDLLTSKPRICAKWVNSTISLGQAANAVSKKNPLLGGAGKICDGVNYFFASKSLFSSVQSFPTAVRKAASLRQIGQSALGILKLVKDLLKCLTSYSSLQAKRLGFGLDAVCTLGTAADSALHLKERIQSTSKSNPLTKKLQIIGNSLDVVSGGLFLGYTLRGRSMHPIVGPFLGAMSLSNAIALHYLT
jgi:hypothetical protein